MEKNVGGWDRIARIVIGAGLLLLGVSGYAGLVRVAFGPVPQALGSILLAVVGLVLLYTGVRQRCHVNKWLGWNTYTPQEE